MVGEMDVHNNNKNLIVKNQSQARCGQTTIASLLFAPKLHKNRELTSFPLFCYVIGYKVLLGNYRFNHIL